MGELPRWPLGEIDHLGTRSGQPDRRRVNPGVREG